MGLVLMFTTAALAQDTGDCASYGTITPDRVSVNPGGEPVTFRVGGGFECGDKSTCAWTVEDDWGTLDPTQGSPVEWTPPAALPGCITETFRIFVACADIGGSSSAEIELRCTDEQRIALQGSTPDATLGGGGCGSPQMAVVLLPLGLLGLRRRWS